jgi:hypothetical protein
MDSALRLRVYALLYRAVLYVRVVFPGTRLCYGKLAHNPDWNSARSTFMPTEMAPTLVLTELLPFRESDVHVGGLPRFIAVGSCFGAKRFNMPDAPKNWAQAVNTLDVVSLILKFVKALIALALIASIPFALMRIIAAVVDAQR